MPDLRKIFSLPATRNYVDVTRLGSAERKNKVASLKRKKRAFVLRPKPAARKIKRIVKVKPLLKPAKIKKSKSISALPKVSKPLKTPKPIVVARVTHFFDKIQVAILKVQTPMKVGDMIRFQGLKTDFAQRIDSMQIDHQQILVAKKNDEIGLKVKLSVSVGDMVFFQNNL